MAEISVSAMANSLGPSIPSMHAAWLEDHPWPGGGTVKRLVLSIGDVTLHIWPADKEAITRLSTKLNKLAREEL
jgi:hypothetical protein